MKTQPNDFVMQAWQQQCDGYLRAMQVLADGVSQLVKVQLEAALDVRPEKYAENWRRFYDICAQTQARLAQCMVPASAAAPNPMQAMPTMMQDVYKQWLETAQQMYKLPAEAAAQHQSEAASRGSARKNKPVAP